MLNFPKKLQKKINQRVLNHSLRTLKKQSNGVDFSSNDYLGFAKSNLIFEKTHQYLIDKNLTINGATGSRLLSGNHDIYTKTETDLCAFHKVEAALIFNSGYDANIGFFAAVPQRGDIILYDEFIHASIRDGIAMSTAKGFKFLHNNVDDLEKKLIQYTQKNKNTTASNTELVEIYVVTEAVFSMDGDSPDLIAMANLCKQYKVHFIVDEAHSVGVFGEKGCGKVQELSLENTVFARIITFGKALGCHGAAVLGSVDLKKYLLNFSRSFIYTTALSPHAVANIKIAYEVLQSSTLSNEFSQIQLQKNIQFFIEEIHRLKLQNCFIKSTSAIHSCIIPNAKKAISIAEKLQHKGFHIKAIVSPTVPKNEERLRFCLHSYHSKKEMTTVLELLRIFVEEATSP